MNVILVISCPAQAEERTKVSKHADQTSSIVDEQSFFNAIELLEHPLALKKQEVENITGIKLHTDESAHMEGNRDRDIYTSDKSKTRFISYLTLDELKKQSSKASGLLVIVFNVNSNSVTEKDIQAKYGKASTIEQQSVLDVPAQNQPLTLSYARKWGTLIFLVEKAKTRRLVQVIVKALGETPALRPAPKASSKL